MAKISQTANYYEIDGNAAGNAVIQINGNTSTTTITGAASITAGLTIDTVGLTVTAGGATITAGGLTVTAGGLTVTAGAITFGGLAGEGLMTTDASGVVSTTATTDGSVLIGNNSSGFSEIAAGTGGNFLVDSSTEFASVAATGDMTLAAGGAFTAADAIILGKTPESTVNDADLVLIYDASAAALRQMTRGNFVAGVAGSPGGLNTQIQYNNSSAFGGDSGFTTDGAGNLTVTGGSLTLSSSTIILDNTLPNSIDVDADVGVYSIFNTLGTTGASELTIGDAGSQNFTLKVKNLTVDGTLTYIDTANLRVEDLEIELNSDASGTGVLPNAGGGLRILSNTGSNTITFTAVSDGGPLRSSSGLSVATGTGYDVNGSSVLTLDTLGSTVVNSSLTSVGTIGTGTWQGTVIGSAYGGTGQDFSGSSGAISVSSGNFSAGTLSVANGGTGATSLTDGGILLGSGTSAITATGQPTNGQLLIGSTGSDPVLATLTAGDGVSITNASGSITIAADTSGDKVTGSYTASSAYDIDFTIPTGTRTNVGFRATVYLEDSTTANSALVTIEGIVVRSSGAPLLPDFLFVVVPGTDGNKLSLGTGGANTLRIASTGPAGSGNYVATVIWTED